MQRNPYNTSSSVRQQHIRAEVVSAGSYIWRGSFAGEGIERCSLCYEYGDTLLLVAVQDHSRVHPLWWEIE